MCHFRNLLYICIYHYTNLKRLTNSDWLVIRILNDCGIYLNFKIYLIIASTGDSPFSTKIGYKKLLAILARLIRLIRCKIRKAVSSIESYGENTFSINTLYTIK